MVKILPANARDIREAGSISGWGRSLGRGNPLLHFNNLAWRVPWTEELGRLLSIESQRAGHN